MLHSWSFCRIGVLIIDEKSHNTPAALEAAQRVRDDGINMIVVGIEVRKLWMIELFMVTLA